MSDLEEFYRMLWPSFDANANRFAALDEPLATPSFDPVFELARDLRPGQTVLDLGCGKGRQSVKLVKELGVSVIALDPLANHLEMARGHAEREGVAGSIRFVLASAESIPLEDASIDLVWCRDTFHHVADIERATQESSRVLKHDGRMINISAVARPDFDRREAAAVAAGIGLNPATFEKETIDAAFLRAGFAVLEEGSMSREGSKFLEAVDVLHGRDLLRYAHLLRNPTKLSEALGGREIARRLEAYYLWNVYLVICKIEYWVWVLRRTRL